MALYTKSPELLSALITIIIFFFFFIFAFLISVSFSMTAHIFHLFIATISSFPAIHLSSSACSSIYNLSYFWHLSFADTRFYSYNFSTCGLSSEHLLFFSLLFIKNEGKKKKKIKKMPNKKMAHVNLGIIYTK